LDRLSENDTGESRDK